MHIKEIRSSNAQACIYRKFAQFLMRLDSNDGSQRKLGPFNDLRARPLKCERPTQETNLLEVLLCHVEGLVRATEVPVLFVQLTLALFHGHGRENTVPVDSPLHTSITLTTQFNLLHFMSGFLCVPPRRFSCQFKRAGTGIIFNKKLTQYFVRRYDDLQGVGYELADADRVPTDPGGRSEESKD